MRPIHEPHSKFRLGYSTISQAPAPKRSLRASLPPPSPHCLPINRLFPPFSILRLEASSTTQSLHACQTSSTS